MWIYQVKKTIKDECKPMRIKPDIRKIKFKYANISITHQTLNHSWLTKQIYV